MKALFVHDHIFYKIEDEYYSPGGLPSYAWNRYLKNFECLTVIARGIDEAHTSGLVKSSVEKVSFDLLYQVKGGLDYYRYKKDIQYKLIEHIKKVDVVIIRMPSTLGYFAFQVAKKLNVPIVTEVVGCAWDSTWNYGSLLIKVQGPYRYYQMKKVVRESFAVTYVTQQFLQKRYPTETKITSYASNVQIPSVVDEVLDAHLNLLGESFENKIIRLGIIGNLSVKYKGYDVAIEALQVIKKTYPNLKFCFYLVGGGDSSYVKKLINNSNLKEECVVVGRLKAGDEIFSFLDSLHLYIHPSKQEGLPRAVIEAMSRGCPVLASSVAGIPELLPSQFLHKPGDYNKLATDISEVLTNKKLMYEMSKQNFVKAQEYNSLLLEERRIGFFKEVLLTLKQIKK